MLQSSALPSDIPKKTEVSLAKPGAVTGSEKKPSVHTYAPLKAGVCAQPARWQNPHNHLSLSQILQQVLATEQPDPGCDCDPSMCSCGAEFGRGMQDSSSHN